MEKEVYVGYIKEFLHEFYLPTIKVLKDNLYVIEHSLYIKDNNIYCALKDGIYLSGDEKNKKLFHKMYNTYSYGKRFRNLTKNLTLNSNIWDAYSHEYLGEYLRFLRDYKNIDLMSMYNCYCGKILDNEIISFTEKTKVSGKDGKITTKATTNVFADWRDTTHKVFCVPIKPFNQYTIAYSCDTKVEMMACFFRNGQLLFNEYSGYSFSNTYRKATGLDYNHPYLYTGVYGDYAEQFKSSKFNKFQNDLVLLIKAPIDCQSSLVVLEGDYSKSNQQILHNSSKAEMANKIIYAQECSHVLDGEIYPFMNRQTIARGHVPTMNKLLSLNKSAMNYISDNLISYLYKNVIAPDDTISNNIVRVQKQLLNRPPYEGRLRKIGISGEYSEAVRNAAYDAMVHDGVVDDHYDVLGYIDRITESKIILQDEVK